MEQSNLAYREGYPGEWWTKQIIAGKVVMMAPAIVNHNRIALNISNIFYTFLFQSTQLLRIFHRFGSPSL